MVRHDARDIALDGVVPAVLPPAGTDVVALLEFGEHARNIFRIILPIPIHRNDHVTRCEIKARHHRCRLAKISAEMDHLHLPMRRGQCVEDLLASVQTSIIDENDLPRFPVPIHDDAHFLEKFLNGALFVVYRNGQ